jgi:hypothetical protein
MRKRFKAVRVPSTELPRLSAKRAQAEATLDNLPNASWPQGLGSGFRYPKISVLFGFEPKAGSRENDTGLDAFCRFELVVEVRGQQAAPSGAGGTLLFETGIGTGTKMNMDRRTAQSLLKAAMGQRPPPGKYDVFAWKEDQKYQSLTVAWKSYTKRSVALENVADDGGEEIAMNAEPLPNGRARKSASYVGSFRIEASRRDEA